MPSPRAAWITWLVQSQPELHYRELISKKLEKNFRRHLAFVLDKARAVKTFSKLGIDRNILFLKNLQLVASCMVMKLRFPPKFTAR